MVVAPPDVDVVDRRGPQHVLKVIQQITQIIGCESADEAARAITAFIRSIHCETRLLELNITSDADRNKIARSVNASRLANNPRAVRSQEIFEILDSIR